MEIKKDTIYNCEFETKVGNFDARVTAWVYTGQPNENINDDDIYYYAKPTELVEGNILGDAKLINIIEEL